MDVNCAQMRKHQRTRQPFIIGPEVFCYHHRESGWVGFVEAAIFIFVLLAGLVYLVRIGALDWTPARSRRERMNPETNSIANRQR